MPQFITWLMVDGERKEDTKKELRQISMEMSVCLSSLFSDWELI